MRSSQHQTEPSEGSPSLPKLHGKLGSPGQLRLDFDPSDPRQTAFDDDEIVRGTISAAIKACGLSRAQIADRMSAILPTRITTAMLNDFSAESKAFHRWPAAWDRAFCEAVGDDSLLICRVLRAGLFVITSEEKDILELGRQYLIRKRADEQAQLLEKRLEGADL